MDTSRRPHTEVPGQASPLNSLIVSFRRSLLARNASQRTVTAYIGVANRFASYLSEQGMPTDPSMITREHVETFLNNTPAVSITHPASAPSSMTRKLWYASLRVFFKWLVEVDEIKRSPIERMSPPKAISRKRPVLTHEQVRAVLKTCEGGKTFKDRRDHARILRFIDTGLRLSEMAELRLDAIDWNQQQIEVRFGKGGKHRTVYFGRRAAKVLDQYVYLKSGRRDHKYAYLPYLWLGLRGKLTKDGISEMLKARGEEADVPNLHPHLWRHFFIHSSLQAGVQLGDLQRQTGHSNLFTLLGYAGAAADERARESHRKMGPGDRL